MSGGAGSHRVQNSQPRGGAKSLGTCRAWKQVLGVTRFLVYFFLGEIVSQ